MNLFPVSSSQLAALGFDSAKERMQIRFAPKADGTPGPLYQYYNINLTIQGQFENAQSKGSFFIKVIKRNPELYPYVKLDPVTPVEVAQSIARLRTQCDVVDYLEALPDAIVGHPQVQQAVTERAKAETA